MFRDPPPWPSRPPPMIYHLLVLPDHDPNLHMQIEIFVVELFYQLQY